MIHAGMAQHGTVVFAHEQTRGKGQREKHWISAPGENIMLSIILQPFSLTIPQQFLLSMTIANGVHSFFSRYGGADSKIKWPNDLYWRDRKAGGILIENIIQGQAWKWSVAGIGININQTQFEPRARNAVSLKEVTRRQWLVIEAARELITNLNSEISLLLRSPSEIPKRYHQALYKFKEVQEFRKNGESFLASVDGVSEDGRLMITHHHQEKFKTGEIEWVIR